MSRSIKKGYFVHYSLMEKIERMKKDNKKIPIKTWSRSSMIIPEFIGYTFNVHNGKTFIKIFITEEHVGHRLGEFAPTRKPCKHPVKKDR